jgi:type III secretory pathway component EscU
MLEPPCATSHAIHKFQNFHIQSVSVTNNIATITEVLELACTTLKLLLYSNARTFMYNIPFITKVLELWYTVWRLLLSCLNLHILYRVAFVTTVLKLTETTFDQLKIILELTYTTLYQVHCSSNRTKALKFQ